MSERLKEMEGLDREKLISMMGQALPDMIEKADMTEESLSIKSGIGIDKIQMAIRGDAGSLKWSEYLALLFIFWKNEACRDMVEDKGMFPKQLKEVFSINRNVHSPQCEIG